MLHRAGKASTRRRPVNSALGAGHFSASSVLNSGLCFATDIAFASALACMPSFPAGTGRLIQPVTSEDTRPPLVACLRPHPRATRPPRSLFAHKLYPGLAPVRPGRAFARAAPNLSLKRTANGMAPWPRGAQAYHAPHGQGTTPLSAV